MRLTRRTLLGMVTAAAAAPFLSTRAAFAEGIFRSHPDDRINWQTGVDQRFFMPFDIGPGECAIIDAAHVVMDGQFIQGPLFMVVEGPFSGGRLQVIEGQVIVPHASKFDQRFVDRIRVAQAQGKRMQVPDKFGNLRPRRESTELRLVGPLTCGNGGDVDC